MNPMASVTIIPGAVTVNGSPFTVPSSDYSLPAIYRAIAPGYPKFFKMDGMARLGFLASELLLGPLAPECKNDLDIIIFSSAGSIATDRHYQSTIPVGEGYFPSPAVFVYTLANIVAGEIAIRHKINGETSLYMLPDGSSAFMDTIIDTHSRLYPSRMLLTGRIDYFGEDDYFCEMNLYGRHDG